MPVAKSKWKLQFNTGDAMGKIRRFLFVMLFLVAVPAAGRAQCGLIGSYTATCHGGCVVSIKACRAGTQKCYEEFPGVQCPCDVNECWGTATDTGPNRDVPVRPTVRAALKTSAGAARSLFLYLANCDGTYSLEKVVA